MMSLKLVVLITFVFGFAVSKAQDIKFDSTGKLLSFTKSSSHQISTAELTGLNEISERIRTRSRELLGEKVEEALRILKSNRYKQSLHKLYLFIFEEDSAALVSHLEGLRAMLSSGRNSSLDSAIAGPFNNAFNNHLSDAAAVFHWEPSSDKRAGLLWKRNPLASFTVDYYNETLKNTKLTEVHLNKEDLIEATYYLVGQLITADTLLKRYRRHANSNVFNKHFYDSLTQFHTQLVHQNSRFSALRKMFRQRWFKDWFWFRGGEIRINPLDISVRDSLNKRPSLDIFNALAPSETSNKEFYLEDRLDSLNNFFRNNETTYFTSRQLINEVSVPNSGTYFNFSASGKIKFQNNEAKLTEPTYTTDKKILAVHNIPKERRLGIVEERKLDADRSEFQQGLDGVVTNLGLLAGVYAKLTPYGSILDFFLPSVSYKNNVIKPSIQKSGPGFVGTPKSIVVIKIYDSPKLSISGERDEEFVEKLKKRLRAEKLYDEESFNVFENLSLTMEEAANQIDELQAPLKIYLQRLMEKAGDQVNLDRFYLNGFLTIYNESSTPLLKEIRPLQDKNTSFYSEISETTPVDSAVVNNVKLYTVNAKTNADTVVLSRFKYKIGKNKKFTLSAGIAYTLNSYNQSVAREEGGTIKISNNNTQYKLVAGINYYLGKGLYSHNNSFWGKNSERTYVFVGVGIPRPLENLYIGLGRDLFPGLKLTAGMHIAKNNQYFIQNNEIVEERLNYQLAGPFLSLKVDPTSLLSVFEIFKKD